jgi:hypothetical protein
VKLKGEDPPAPKFEEIDVQSRKRIKGIWVVEEPRGKEKPMVAPPQPTGRPLPRFTDLIAATFRSQSADDRSV